MRKEVDRNVWKQHEIEVVILLKEFLEIIGKVYA